MTTPVNTQNYAVSVGTSFNRTPHFDTRAPASTDINYPLGQVWIDKLANAVYELTSFASSLGTISATWTQSATLSGGVLPVSQGGTGDSTLTAHGVLVGEGTSPITALAVGTTGQVLIGATGADPAFGALGVNSNLTAHGVLLGEGNSAIVATSAGTTGQVLIGSTGADPAFGDLGVNSNLTGLVLGNTNSAFTAETFVASTAWTPDLQINGSSTGITYSTQSGFYSRIGNVVYVTAEITLTSKGSSNGNVTISNMPVITGASGSVNTISVWASSVTLSANYTTVQLDLGDASQVASLFMSGSGQVTAAVTDAMLANDSTINLSGVYFLN